MELYAEEGVMANKKENTWLVSVLEEEDTPPTFRNWTKAQIENHGSDGIAIIDKKGNLIKGFYGPMPKLR
jgi:hypothetical protein